MQYTVLKLISSTFIAPVASEERRRGGKNDKVENLMGNEIRDIQSLRCPADTGISFHMDDSDLDDR